VRPQHLIALGAVLVLLFTVGVFVQQRDGAVGLSQRDALPTNSPELKPSRPLVDKRDASQVRRQFDALPAVNSAVMSLGNDDQLSTAVQYELEMRENANDKAVLRVIKAAYRVFARNFGSTSASLEINRLNDQVTLQTRKPTAATAEVMRIARYAFTEAAHDDLVVLHIQARDDQPRRLHGEVLVNLRGGRSRTPADVLDRLDAIDPQEIPPHTGVGVTDDAGDGLSGDIGLPTTQARALWANLIDHSFPARVGFHLSADVGPHGEHAWFTNVVIWRTTAETAPEDLAALLKHTLDVMGETGEPFKLYGLTSPTVDYTIWFDSANCRLTAPEWLKDVEREYSLDKRCG
jgi:hypothetical protein